MVWDAVCATHARLQGRLPWRPPGPSALSSNSYHVPTALQQVPGAQPTGRLISGAQTFQA